MTNSLNQAPFTPFLERVKTGNYIPGDDPINRLAIAIDGGGMTTIHNVGMARVLEDNGIFDVSEMIVGISAGAKLAASVVSGQLTNAEEMFKYSLVNRKFINLWRLFSDGRVPVLNLSLLKEMITVENPLDTTKIENSPTELGIGITDLTNFQPVVVSSRSIKGDQITDATMRSVHMPWVAGAPTVKDGVAWGDGGLSWMATSHVAKKLGATKIIELSNNPLSTWEHHKIISGIVSLWIHRYGSAESALKYRNFVKEQVGFMNCGVVNSDVINIYPDIENRLLPGTLCSKMQFLEQGYKIGLETAKAALGYESDVIPTYPETKRTLIRILGFGKVATANSTIFPLISAT